MATIDTVIFDIGNVLIRWDMRNLYRKLFSDDAAVADFIEETGLTAENLEFDRGKPFATGLSELVARFPHHQVALSAFDARWAECLDGAIEANVKVLRDLQAAGVPVHAITNFSAEKFPIACEIFPFLRSFDDIVVSGAVGLIKPDPAIYRVLFERQAINPRRAVFIDDSAANIATAGRLGLHTVHFRDENVDLRVALRQLGLVGV